MPIKTKLYRGSCHCRRVKFTFRSGLVHPYQRCYCSICRKVQGGGGYAINLSGEAASLKVTGARYVKKYRAILGKKNSAALRNFCGYCGSMLWLFDPGWPELIHPFASAIDSKLPLAPETTHLMLKFKPAWIKVDKQKGDRTFSLYPKESIAAWHERLHLEGK
ncbi:MAG: GFA family protein [Proteobacteria bacterium]|nr:MAG: GFA family protein [Pseudomonadota bacterium]